MFPANSVMHADVRTAPVHANSGAWVGRIGPTYGLKADFGAGLWDGGPIGIPYTTVAGTQARVPVTFTWPEESDAGPYPIPPNAPVEGGSSSTGDRHVLVVDRDRCELWETYSSYPQNGGASWTAGSGVHFNLSSNAMRTSGWTSADAAGLPILPFLVRYDEIAAGVIDHPLRITVPRTASAFVWPASHRAGTGTVDDPPMGSWFRLRADFDISGFSTTNQIILRALKEHGAVLADNGSRWYMSGVPDERWDNSDLQRLGQVPGSAFDVVDVSQMKVAANSYQFGATSSTTTTTLTTTTTTSTTSTTSTTTTTVPAPPPSGRNGTFEGGVSGWTANVRTRLDRVSPGHAGSWAGRMTCTAATGDIAINDAPDWIASTAARAYTGKAWVLVPAGRTVRLAFEERRNGLVVNTKKTSLVGTGAWQLVSVTMTPAAGSQLGVKVVGVSFANGQVMRVDDITVA